MSNDQFSMVNSQIQYLLKATIRSTIKRCNEGGNLENKVLPLRLCAVVGGISINSTAEEHEP